MVLALISVFLFSFLFSFVCWIDLEEEEEEEGGGGGLD